MDTFKTFLEDLASGRPAKKPVSSNLLKQRARENKKALDTGFMKMPDYVKKKFNEEEEYKSHMMYKGKKKVMAKKKEDHDRLNKQGYDHDNPETEKVEEEKKNCGCGQDPCITYGKQEKMKESSRDKYNPKVSKMRTKEKMNKVGLPVDSPLVTEESKPTNPALWSKAKAAARSKFDVYPSAYANGWAVQWYKKRGGGWSKGKATKESVELPEGAFKRMATDKAEKERLAPLNLSKSKKIKLYPQKGKTPYREEQMQLVTNLDLDESIANLVRRGVGKVKDSLQKAGNVKDSLQKAGQQYKDSQEKSMKAGKGIYQNPVSGDNIRKRMKQMQSQKKRLTK